MRSVASLCALAACGRIGFDTSASGSSDGNPGGDAPTLADAPTDASTDAPASVQCAPSYTKNVGGTLIRAGGPDTWLNGEQACAADGPGMHLVEIANFVDQQVIEAYIDPAPAAWVGISDRLVDNTFVRVIGGGPMYLPWGAGEPSFVGPGCVILDPIQRTYLDGDCGQMLVYVCQCDGIVENPATY